MKRALRFPSRWASRMLTLLTVAVLPVALGACEIHKIFQILGIFGSNNYRRFYFKKTGIPKIDNNREYHAGKDEIEAYAHCVYLDFKVRRPNIPIATLIRYAKTYKVSKNLAGIQRVFQTDFYRHQTVAMRTTQISVQATTRRKDISGGMF